MADHIVMPPVGLCQCAHCIKRHIELKLAEDIEWELYCDARKDIPVIKRDALPPPPRKRRRFDRGEGEQWRIGSGNRWRA